MTFLSRSGESDGLPSVAGLWTGLGPGCRQAEGLREHRDLDGLYRAPSLTQELVGAWCLGLVYLASFMHVVHALLILVSYSPILPPLPHR